MSILLNMKNRVTHLNQLVTRIYQRRERIVNRSPKALIISFINLYFTVSVTLLSPKAFFETCN